MIRTFADTATRNLFEGQRVRRWVNIEVVAMRKLAMLHRATRLADLRIPPANRLEALKGRRAGQYSLRINDQFRVCGEMAMLMMSRLSITTERYLQGDCRARRCLPHTW